MTDQKERRHLAASPGGPWVSSWVPSSEHDVNPACGCHMRALCGGCGVCTTCLGCHCREAGEADRVDAEAAEDARVHAGHDGHREGCSRCAYERECSSGYTRCPKCAVPYADGARDHQRHNPPYCLPLPRYKLGVDWGYLRGQEVTLVGRDRVHGLVLAEQEAPDPGDYSPRLLIRRTDPGYEDGPDETSSVDPRGWLEVHPAPPGG
ncbi:hypothetical protein ACWEBX_03210 [Streptomyces sp. NPDC005070]